MSALGFDHRYFFAVLGEMRQSGVAELVEGVMPAVWFGGGVGEELFGLAVGQPGAAGVGELVRALLSDRAGG